MKCEQIRQQLSAFLDGELDSDTRDAVRSHLRDCPDCSLHYEELKSLDDSVRDLLRTDPSVSETFTGHLLNRAARQLDPGETPDGPARGSTAKALTLGAITLLIGLFAGTYLGFGFINAVETRSNQLAAGDRVEQPPTETSPTENASVVSFNDAYFELANAESAGNNP